LVAEFNDESLGGFLEPHHFLNEITKAGEAGVVHKLNC
jgi:hypothetical protein